MEIRLIVDSCCDSTPKLREQLKMDIAPLKVRVGDASFTDDSSATQEDILKAMAHCKEAASSSCPSPEKYARCMRQYDACIVITLSSKLSESYNSACVAAHMIHEETPKKPIYVLDSKSASAGELLLALYVRERIDASDCFRKIVEQAETYITRLRTFFVLEDLGNFVKNGRLSKVSGVVASILSLCPIMGEDGNGEVHMITKCRGNRNALERLVELTAKNTAACPTVPYV